MKVLMILLFYMMIPQLAYKSNVDQIEKRRDIYQHFQDDLKLKIYIFEISKNIFF